VNGCIYLVLGGVSLRCFGKRGMKYKHTHTEHDKTGGCVPFYLRKTHRMPASLLGTFPSLGKTTKRVKIPYPFFYSFFDS